MPGSDDDDPDSSGVYPPDDFGIETKNKEDWCDMSDPFENPFCPTPNPMFNVLIKMVIPGKFSLFHSCLRMVCT